LIVSYLFADVVMGGLQSAKFTNVSRAGSPTIVTVKPRTIWRQTTSLFLADLSRI